MQEILEVIDSYGIDTVVLALIINVLTGIVKIPIKHLSTPRKWSGTQERSGWRWVRVFL